MSIDPNRATFVRREFREFEKSDASVLAKFPAARSVTITTNLNADDATALAVKTLEAGKEPQVTFEIVFDGTMELDSLVGQNPAAIVNFPRFATINKQMRIVSVVTDYELNTATVRVRG